MDFQKVMTMIDDISQHLPEQKYIEIVNNLKKEYDNANDDTDDDDDDDYYHNLLVNLFHQLEYDLYSYIKINKKIKIKDVDMDKEINKVNINTFRKTGRGVWYEMVRIIEDYHTENTTKNYAIWDYIEFITFKKDRIVNMIGKNSFYYDDLRHRDDYINLFAEFVIESVKWYLRQEFQTKKYIDRCWSKLCLEYDRCYDGREGDWDFLEDIQFPKDYFDGMDTSDTLVYYLISYL